jgi:hypothetical protein
LAAAVILQSYLNFHTFTHRQWENDSPNSRIKKDLKWCYDFEIWKNLIYNWLYAHIDSSCFFWA